MICFQACKVWYTWFLSVVGLYFFQWPRLGQVIFSSTLEKQKSLKADKEVDVKQLHLHKPLESTWPKVNKQFLSAVDKPIDSSFTPLQRELFCIMNSYRDLFYPERNALTNGEEIRHAYCLHALNHVLKANAQVLSNNAKRRDRKPGTDTDDHRDQGLTRPKVRELWCPDPHPGNLLRLYKYPGSSSTSISVAALRWCVPGHMLFYIPLSCLEVVLHGQGKCCVRSSELRVVSQPGSVQSHEFDLSLFFLFPYHPRLTSCPASIFKSASADRCLHVNLQYQWR